MRCTAACRKPNGRQAHCALCHRTFGGVTGFDDHRRGELGARYCVDPSTIGMNLTGRGVWSYPGDGAYWARPQSSVDARSADTGLPVGNHGSGDFKAGKTPGGVS